MIVNQWVPAAHNDRISRVIFDYAVRISHEQDPGALLRLNADMARDLVGADRCSIWLLDTSRGEMWTNIAHGVDELRIQSGQGLVGACVSSNAPNCRERPGYGCPLLSKRGCFERLPNKQRPGDPTTYC